MAEVSRAPSPALASAVAVFTAAALLLRRREASVSPLRTRKETLLRAKLAALYRIAGDFGWDEVVYNHITLRVTATTFLINPFGLRFAEITASSLVTIDVNGNIMDHGDTGRGVNCPGFVIHSAIHAARHDLECVMHSHHTPTTAVASQLGGRAGLLPLSQEACIIWPRVSPLRHPFEGLASDAAEQERLVACFGSDPSIQIVLLANHGALCCGGTVEEAFWNTYVLSRACELQVQAMAAVGGDVSRLSVASDAVVKQTAARLAVALEAQGNEQWGRVEFEALRRALDRKDSSYRR